MENKEKRNVLIAGGTGLIGRALARFLEEQNYNVSILTRKANDKTKFESFYWNPEKNEIDNNALRSQNYIINLAGESISAKYWTKKRKKQILNSRLQAITTLYSGLKQNNCKITKIINASAIGYYGDRPDEILNEDSSPGTGFLSQVCQRWEKQADLLPNVTKLRIGIVLSNEGGYLPQIAKILLKRLNIIFGNGKQACSWIHINDLVRAIHHIMELKITQPVYNTCSSASVSVEEMQKEIARHLNINTLPIKLPTGVVKLLLGNFSELFLNDQNVFPKNLMTEGFKFQYSSLKAAL